MLKPIKDLIENKSKIDWNWSKLLGLETGARSALYF